MNLKNEKKPYLEKILDLKNSRLKLIYINEIEKNGK